MAMNFTEGKYFYESKTHFDLFDRDIQVYVGRDSENIDFAYAQRCAESLNNMPEKLIDELCKCSTRYCEEFCDDVGENPPEIKTSRDILKYIYPTTLVVDEQRDGDIVLHLECNCEWEPEHGLEWLVKGDRVLYVGAYSGESAYCDEEQLQKPWNYAYSKS